MAGSFETCNHVVATLYKIEYAHTKGWCNLACTETSCQWNKGTRKEVEPKLMTDLFVRNKLRSKHADIDDENQEETRMKNLNAFDPRIDLDRTITSDDASALIRNIQLINEELVLFKSIESLSITSKENYKYALIGNLK